MDSLHSYITIRMASVFRSLQERYFLGQQTTDRHSRKGRCAFSDGYATPGPAVGRRGGSLFEQQMQIVLSLPGIGPVTVRALRARFHSLHDLLNADTATLATVPGVSPARATA